VLRSAKTALKYASYSIELWLLIALFLGGLIWTSTSSGRSFWGDAACRGYLFPYEVEDGTVVRRGIETAAEQRAAFATAAQRLGADPDESRAIGKSAEILCNQPAKASDAQD
jgi:hypothetical protein